MIFEIVILALAAGCAARLTYLGTKHGWQWVADKLKARALAAEAAIQAKAADVAGPLEADIAKAHARLDRIEDLVSHELGTAVADISDLKTRVTAIEPKAGI